MLEDEIQRAIFKHLRQRPAPNTFAFHPKNGGIHQRGRRRGINAGLGVVSGVPDVIAIKDGKVFAMELKTETGKLTEEQVNAARDLMAAGATVACCYGLDAALRQIETWGLVRGQAA